MSQEFMAVLLVLFVGLVFVLLPAFVRLVERLDGWDETRQELYRRGPKIRMCTKKECGRL